MPVVREEQSADLSAPAPRAPCRRSAPRPAMRERISARTRRFLAALTDVSPVLLWEVDAPFLNEFSRHPWPLDDGLPFESVRSAHWPQVVHPRDRAPCVARVSQAIAAGRPFDVQFRIRQRDGRERWVHQRGRPRRDAAGAVTGYVGYYLPAELSRPAVRGRRPAGGSRSPDWSRRAAELAHELGQPLSAILSHAEACVRMLDAGRTGSEVRDAVRRVRGEADQAAALLRRMRAFARCGRPDAQAVELDAGVADVLALLSGEARRHGVGVHHAPAPVTLWADPVQLRQVLLNLVRNAIEACAGLPAARRRVSVGVRDVANGRARFFVADCGAGVSDEVGRKMFDASFTTKADGLGLGLFITRALVEAHGGRIAWARNGDHGLSVECEWPVAPAGGGRPRAARRPAR